MTRYQYDVTVRISSEIPTIIDALTNESKMKLWQPSLESIENISDRERMLTYLNGSHHMKMKETLLKDERPKSITLCYEVPGVTNICKNIFEKKDKYIKWTMAVTFDFDQPPGLPQDPFEESTKSSMLQLKAYLES